MDSIKFINFMESFTELFIKYPEYGTGIVI